MQWDRQIDAIFSFLFLKRRIYITSIFQQRKCNIKCYSIQCTESNNKLKTARYWKQTYLLCEYAEYWSTFNGSQSGDFHERVYYCTTKTNNKRVTIFICLVARINVEITNKCGWHRKGSVSFHSSAHLLCVIYVSHVSRFEVKIEYKSKCCYAFHHRRFLYILSLYARNAPQLHKICGWMQFFCHQCFSGLFNSRLRM